MFFLNSVEPALIFQYIEIKSFLCHIYGLCPNLSLSVSSCVVKTVPAKKSDQSTKKKSKQTAVPPAKKAVQAPAKKKPKPASSSSSEDSDEEDMEVAKIGKAARAQVCHIPISAQTSDREETLENY